MRLFAIALTVVLLAACSLNQEATTPDPTGSAEAPLTGIVHIEHPRANTVIYSELLFVDGTANNLPDEQFILRLVDIDGAPLAQTDVQVGADGRWQVEFPHGYNGEPSEATLRALPNIDDGRSYDRIALIVSAQSYRPEGTFGSVTFPLEGSTIGGDSIQVMGTASGLFEGDFVLELVEPDGELISQRIVTTHNPYYVDEVPWTTELETAGYTGNAIVRAFAISPRDGSIISLGSVNITLSIAAG